jgi:hypothetical protein
MEKNTLSCLNLDEYAGHSNFLQDGFVALLSVLWCFLMLSIMFGIWAIEEIGSVAAVISFVAFFVGAMYSHSDRKAFRRANVEWVRWRNEAQSASSIEYLTKLTSSSDLANCLIAYLLDVRRSDQYQFSSHSSALSFYIRHRSSVFNRMREAFEPVSGEKALAIGWLQLSDEKSLLCFRQIREDCA